MDRHAMDYRDAAATSPLGHSNDAHSEPRRDFVRQEVRSLDSRPLDTRAERPILQHRRTDGQVAPAQLSGNGAQQRGVQTVSLQSILKGAREAIIDFDGAAYRLRITRNHRLILTK